MVLRAVIFDCDGVLVDTEPLHYQAYQEVLGPLGLGFDYTRYLEHFIGFDDRDAFIEVFRGIEPPLDGRKLSGFIEAKTRALEGIVSKGVSSFPGVVELVRKLAGRGIPLAVASGALSHEVNGFISALGLADAFSVIVTADEVERSKPDPESYLLALERLQRRMGEPGLSSGECLAIEDTPAGIKSAKGAGLLVLGVTNSFPADDLREADSVRETLEGLDFDELNRLMGR
jgi:beta-phosphoglucomutase